MQQRARLAAWLLYLLPAAAMATDTSYRDTALTQITRWQVPGVAVVIVNTASQDQFIYLGTAGANRPVTPNTLFQVGSVSKPVAAWAVMKAIEDGAFQLESTLRTLGIGQLNKSPRPTAALTVKMLLSHTAGLSLSGYAGFRLQEALPDTKGSLAGATNGSGIVQAATSPGAFRYSGGGYTLLQHLIERHSGEPFHRWAATRVLAPLGMTRSSYDPVTSSQPELAEPHDHQGQAIPRSHFRAEAAAGLHSTAEDMARFLRANLEPNPVLAPESVARLHEPVADALGGQIALGFFRTGNSRLLGHNGSNFGYKAAIQFAPAQGKGIAVLTNGARGARVTQALICHWDRAEGINGLTDQCLQQEAAALRAEQHHRWWLGGFGGVLALATLPLAMGALRRRQHFALPDNFGRWFALVLLTASAAVMAALVFTNLGIRLATGMIAPAATIAVLPPGTASLIISALALLLVLASYACRYRRSER